MLFMCLVMEISSHPMLRYHLTLCASLVGRSTSLLLHKSTRRASSRAERERSRTCPTISKCKKGLAEEAIYSNKRGTTVARFHKVHKCKLAQHCNRLARKETLGRWVVAAVQLWTARLHKDAWFPFSRALRPENAAAASCPPRV